MRATTLTCLRLAFRAFRFFRIENSSHPNGFCFEFSFYNAVMKRVRYTLEIKNKEVVRVIKEEGGGLTPASLEHAVF